MWRIALIAASLLFPRLTSAELRHYVASLEDSRWQISQNSPISCRLEHDIPSYGKAVFTSRSGKEMNLNFTLDMWMKPDAVTDAQLISRAPNWRPGINSKKLTNLTYQKYFNGEVPKQMAWSMLAELERGMEPTFYYADWYNGSNKIAVGLSTINFGGKYREFRSCLSNLLPYGFDDIAFTVLNYEFGGTELTRFSKQQLARVQEYLSYDNEVDLVLVDAYTDSYGGRSVNKKTSLKRANSIKAFFLEKGIPQQRIRTVGHGETRHVASNVTAEERSRNRRVVIRITKPL